MDRITLTRPDDWHLHLRDGEMLPPCCRIPRAASPAPSSCPT
jgi:dihydroorotase